MKNALFRAIPIITGYFRYFSNYSVELGRFRYSVTISEKSASTELLQTYIEGFDVSGSIEVYEWLKKKQIDVDLPTKQRLLELVI